MNENIFTITVVLMTCLIFPGCHPEKSRQEILSEHNSSKNEVSAVRYGSVIKLKPEKYDQYKELHALPWSGVDSLLKVYNIRNYSIYYRDGCLFSYLEYTGNSWEEDMAKLADEPIIQQWWKLTDPCQEPVESAAEGEWWATMEELYHLD